MISISTRILAIGDLHFQSHNAMATDAFTSQLCEMIRQKIKDIDAVVILGDILHRHDRVDLFPLHRAVRFLQSVHSTLQNFDPLKRGIPLWIIIGNHDRPNNSTFLTDEHPFTALTGWSNTVVADSPTIVTAPSTEHHKFLLMPYVFPGRFHEALGCDNNSSQSSRIEWWNNPEIVGSDPQSKIIGVFAHQEFKGCLLAGGMVSRWGDDYSTKAPYCVSGHIHKRSKLNNNILYIGAPLQSGLSFATASLMAYNFQKSIPDEEIWKIGPIPIDCVAKFSSKEDFLKVASIAKVTISDIMRLGGVEKVESLTSLINPKVIVKINQSNQNGFSCEKFDLSRREILASPGAMILASFGIPLIIKSRDRPQTLSKLYPQSFFKPSSAQGDDDKTLIKPKSFVVFMQDYINKTSPNISMFIADLFPTILARSSIQNE